MLDLAGSMAIAAATLATLALLAVGTLGSRHQVMDLETSVQHLAETVNQQFAAEVPADRFLATTKDGLENRLAGADDIWLVGVTLSRTIRNHVGELERRLLGDARIKIAIIDPDSTAAGEAARRSTIPHAPEIYEHRLKPSIDLLRHLAATPGANGKLEVRFLDYVPAFGLLLIDPDHEHGVLYVDLYSHRSAGLDPLFMLTPRRDHRWYQHFLQEFEQVWASGRPAGTAEGFPQAEQPAS